MPALRNFRNYRRMVDRPLLRVVASLQAKHGLSWASEAALRGMIFDDCGHMPGVDTLPCAIERLQDRGILVQFWLQPGGLLPNGEQCTRGTRLLFIPQCRRGRRALAAKSRREHISGRIDRRKAYTLAEIKKKIALTPPCSSTAPEDFERARARALAQLQELEAAWAKERDPGT